MPDDYDGLDLVDSAGDHIGTVERTHVDDDGTAHFINVKLGHVFGKHRLVPAEQVERNGESLQVPYTRDTIEESPHIDPDETLEGAHLEAVRAYYSSDLAGTVGDGPKDSHVTQVSSPVGAAGVSVAGASTDDASPDIKTEEVPRGLGEIRELLDA